MIAHHGVRGAAILLVALAALAGCSVPPRHGAADAGAGTADRYVVSGRITAENGTTWTVTPTRGAPVTVALAPQTRYGTTRHPATPAAFPVGTPVRVTGTVPGAGTGTVLTARRVVLGPSAHPSPSPPTRAQPQTPAPTPPPPPRVMSPGAAVAAADGVGHQRPGVRLGVAVADRDTGQVTLGADGTRPFESASVVKLYTVVDVLHRAEDGQVTLSDQDHDDITAALEHSDDDAMDGLWGRWGGTSTVAETVGLAHLQDTAVPTDPDQWGETTTSARDVLAVYRYVATSLAPADRDAVTGALSSASDGGVDGFDQAFGLLDPPRPAGAEAKQGWMSDGSLYLHTTGMPSASSPWVVAVLSEQPGSESWDDARGVVDAASTALTRSLPSTAP